MLESDDYHEWLNDPEINQYSECRWQMWTTEKVRDYIKSLPEDIVFMAIMKNDVHVGNVKLGKPDKFHRFADLGLLINKNCWGRGIATEAIGLMTDFAFNSCGLHKVVAGVYAENSACIRAFQKNGYEIEGTLKDHRFYKDRYVDEILLGKTK